MRWLKTEGKAKSTIEKYGRDVKAFAVWLQGSGITNNSAANYRWYLHETKRRDATGINGVTASLNSFFRFMKCEVQLKPLKIQKNTFKAQEKELTKEEYTRLLIAAKCKNNRRLNLILQTICSTGIRVSELRFITVESVHSGKAEITNKGKTRIIFIPRKLKHPLLAYAKVQGIESGVIFRTRKGQPVNRSNVWAEMKHISKSAGVEPTKVFPHNLRSLFARLFYRRNRDIARLADILGHSDVNTTRIYLMENGDQHRRRINALDLVMTED